MKKKLIVIFLIVVMVPAMLFAKAFGFNVGGTVTYNVAADQLGETGMEGLGDIKNYNFGLDLRMKLLVFNITALATYNPTGTVEGGEETYHTFAGMLAAGLAFDIFDVVRLGVGFGPRLQVVTDGTDLTVFDHAGVEVADADFGAAFMNAPMSYRATVDFLLGPVSLGVSYLVDSKFTFANPEGKNLLPDWKKGQLGASVMFNI